MKQTLLEDVLNHILQVYRLGDLISLSSLEDVHANQNFFLETTTGEYVLKDLREHEKNRYREEYSFLHRMLDHGVPLPLPLLVDERDPILEYGGKIFMLLEKLPGSSPVPNLAVNKELGRALARLHQVPTEALPNRRPWMSNAFFEENFQNLQREFPEQSQRILQAYHQLPDFSQLSLPQSIIHGDIHPVNCLFQNDQLIALLDWEDMGLGSSVIDLAYTILCFCFVDPDDPDPSGSHESNHRFQKPLFEALLSAYESIRPLQDQERELMGDALRFTTLSLCCWYLQRYGKHPDLNKQKKFELYWEIGVENWDH